MDRPDPRTGQHRDHALRNGGEVDRHAITLFHADLQKDVRHTADFPMERAVS